MEIKWVNPFTADEIYSLIPFVPSTELENSLDRMCTGQQSASLSCYDLAITA